jgi:hypothetical protein
MASKDRRGQRTVGRPGGGEGRAGGAKRCDPKGVRVGGTPAVRTSVLKTGRFTGTQAAPSVTVSLFHWKGAGVAGHVLSAPSRKLTGRREPRE